MKKLLSFLVMIGAVPMTAAWSKTTANDGNWAAKHVELLNTPQAQLMARVGDVDNLGFDWPTGFDPFSGASTPSHGYPWTVDPTDPAGTDRIMVVSSYNGSPPAGTDGYTSYTSRPDNTPAPVVLSYQLQGVTVNDAAFQIFVDDFQASVWGADYTVTLNGKRYGALEQIINSLVQTGPIGKLITVQVPQDLLPEIAKGKVSLFFDDKTTGAGDGYAIDFVKLLVNVKGNLHAGSISGHVSEEGTGKALKGATIKAFNSSTTTDANGDYTLNGVPAGLAHVTCGLKGYIGEETNVDVLAGQNTPNVDFQLAIAPLKPYINSLIVARGNSVTLSVSAVGDSLSYQWYQGAKGDTSKPVSGANSASYTTPELTVSTQYWVRVSNGGGYVDSETITVTVMVPPAISTQPANVTIRPGTKTTLRVVAHGTALKYKWFRGRSGDTSHPISGATASTYTTPVLDASAKFWVRVSNPLGYVNSRTASVSATGP